MARKKTSKKKKATKKTKKKVAKKKAATKRRTRRKPSRKKVTKKKPAKRTSRKKKPAKKSRKQISSLKKRRTQEAELDVVPSEDDVEITLSRPIIIRGDSFSIELPEDEVEELVETDLGGGDRRWKYELQLKANHPHYGRPQRTDNIVVEQRGTGRKHRHHRPKYIKIFFSRGETVSTKHEVEINARDVEFMSNKRLSMTSTAPLTYTYPDGDMFIWGKIRVRRRRVFIKNYTDHYKIEMEVSSK